MKQPKSPRGFNFEGCKMATCDICRTFFANVRQLGAHVRSCRQVVEDQSDGEDATITLPEAPPQISHGEDSIITMPEAPQAQLQQAPTDLVLYKLAQREPFFGQQGPVAVLRNRTNNRRCRDMTEVQYICTLLYYLPRLQYICTLQISVLLHLFLFVCFFHLDTMHVCADAKVMENLCAGRLRLLF